MSGADDRSPDRLFGGRLLLKQPAKGHRVGTDAVLLAAAAAPIASGVAIDLGAGVGAVGLAFAQRCAGASVLLVDNDPEALALARDNIALNGLAGRASTINADVLSPHRIRRAAGLTPALANIVLSNPPFGSAERMRPSPDGNRASAHVMPAGGLKKWIAAAADLIAPRGVYVMIHRADALGEALAALEGWLGSIFLKPVHPRADAPASRILIRAVKGGRAPLVLAPPLVLHDANGRFTAEAESIHRGEGDISL